MDVFDPDEPVVVNQGEPIQVKPNSVLYQEGGPDGTTWGELVERTQARYLNLALMTHYGLKQAIVSKRYARTVYARDECWAEEADEPYGPFEEVPDSRFPTLRATFHG